MTAKQIAVSTLSFRCPTCGAEPHVRCVSLKASNMSRREIERMLQIGEETRLIKSHGARRLLAQRAGPAPR